MNDDDTLIIWIEIGALAAVLAVLAFPLGWWLEQATDQAAWAQAIGSVGAILVAVWVDRGSARRQQLRDTADKWARINVGFAMLSQAEDFAKAAIQSIQEPVRLSAKNGESVLDTLNSINLLDMGSQKAALRLVHIRRHIMFFNEAFAKRIKLPQVVGRGHPNFAVVRELDAALEKYANRIHEDYKAAVVELEALSAEDNRALGEFHYDSTPF